MNGNRKALGAMAAVMVLGMLLALAGPADAGTLNVQNGSRYAGGFGLQVSPDATPAYVQTSHPNAEKAYRVRFYVNATRLNLMDGSSFELLTAYDGADPLASAPPAGNAVLRVSVRQLAGGDMELDVVTRLDGGGTATLTPPVPLSDGWKMVELHWVAATPPMTNGSVSVWLNGVAQTSNLTGLNNDEQIINYSRWGSVTGATLGTPPTGAGTNRFWLDDFGSQRTGYQGQVQVFNDVPLADPLFRFIQGVYSVEVTAGCGGGNYCPADVVTREQMAVFLERGSRGPLFTPPVGVGIFADVPPGFFRDFIEQLFNDGITAGCSTTPMLFCPTNPVTRAQMAVFLLRAKFGPAYTPPPATGTVFGDVDADDFAAAFIEQLAAMGISSGCGGGNYCPNDSVTRAQMAVFLVRTFEFQTQELGP
jgi:S-layer homology domain